MLTRIILSLIRFYRFFLSPLTFSSCRFAPSCSVYAMEAVERFGPAKGLFLAAWRLLRCHPFHPGGYDPVIKSTASHEAEGMPERDRKGRINGGYSWKNARS